MKTVFIVQSTPVVLDLIQKKITTVFSAVDNVIYESNFEKTLSIIPKDEEIIVIASNFYHDKENILFSSREKNGSRLAEEIKKINSLAKVYIFSESEPHKEYIDGFFQKSKMGDRTGDEIVEIFYKLNLSLKPTRRNKRFSVINDPHSPDWGIGTGKHCPDCGGPCGNENHTRRW